MSSAKRPSAPTEKTATRMRFRQKIEALLPVTPREKIKGLLRRSIYPNYRLTLDPRKLAVYTVLNAEPAVWSADSQKPFGTLMTEYSFSHYLLARAMIHNGHIHSWCDLGTGSATLPFQVARLGISAVFAIDGSDAPLRAGKVQLPLSNFCVADITLPLEIRGEDGEPASFDVVSALELVEHIPESKLEGLIANIRRLRPKFILFAVGLQPDPPYHVNLKSMAEWIRDLSGLLPGWEYDEPLSARIFRATRRHARFVNDYPTNHLPGHRNLLIFTGTQRT